MTNPIKSIGHVLKVIAVHIARGFLMLVGKERAEAFGKATLELLKSEVGQIVLKVCEALMTLPASGAEKRDQAFKQVKDQLVASGKEVKDSFIYLLIELAVSVLKGTIKEA